MINATINSRDIWKKMHFDFFDAANLDTNEELNAAYLEQVKAAKGVSEELKQEFNQLKGYLFNRHKNSKGVIYETKNKQHTLFEQFIAEFIGEELKGKLHLEILGSWVWITTNDRTNREALKNAGARWSSNKKAWYWTPEGLGNKRHKAFYKNYNDLKEHWTGGFFGALAGNTTETMIFDPSKDVALPF